MKPYIVVAYFTTGTLYEADIHDLWAALKELEASEEGIVFDDCQTHNPSYTVAGETYAPKVEIIARSEEHTSELQSHSDLVCRLLLEKKQKKKRKK